MDNDDELVAIYQEQIVEGVVDILIMQANNLSDFQMEMIGPPMVVSVLTSISQTEESWYQVISYIIEKVPIYAINVIRDIITDVPCPTIAYINTLLSEHYELTGARAANPSNDRQEERNICIVLGCLAEKLAGTQSTLIFSTDVCNYLFEFLSSDSRWVQVLFAFLALEKFAVTTENKEIIANRFANTEPHPLVRLLYQVDSSDNIFRQIGFCARWALDNTFLIPNRRLSFEDMDMSRINCILRQDNEMFMKLSPDGLEVRCDTASVGTVLATCEVGQGSWYFEVTVVTSGAVRIGLITSATVMDDSYALGEDNTSIGFDGCTRLFWSEGVSRQLFDIDPWCPGEVMGLYINTILKKITVIRSDESVSITLNDFFEDTEGTKKFIPAATISPYEQCRFNFGADPFVYRVPEDVAYSTFNEVGLLTAEQKIVKPRHVFQVENSVFNESANACEICYDNVADVRLAPCGHNTFCSNCASKFQNCPICRDAIAERVNITERV